VFFFFFRLFSEHGTVLYRTVQYPDMAECNISRIKNQSFFTCVIYHRSREDSADAVMCPPLFSESPCSAFSFFVTTSHHLVNPSITSLPFASSPPLLCSPPLLPAALFLSSIDSRTQKRPSHPLCKCRRGRAWRNTRPTWRTHLPAISRGALARTAPCSSTRISGASSTTLQPQLEGFGALGEAGYV
jgi:hypothetical protein